MSKKITAFFAKLRGVFSRRPKEGKPEAAR